MKKYEGEHQLTLPYSKEQWEEMTEYEKNEFVERVSSININEYIKLIKIAKTNIKPN